MNTFVECKMKVYRTALHDHFQRRVYIDEKGRKYVDVNLDDNNPSIHAISKSGEPEYEVKVEIVDEQ